MSISLQEIIQMQASTYKTHLFISILLMFCYHFLQNLSGNPKCSLLVAKDLEDRTDTVITVYGDAVPVIPFLFLLCTPVVYILSCMFSPVTFLYRHIAKCLLLNCSVYVI
jgi:hypothetical protein